MLRKKFKWIHKNESTKARHRDGQARKSYEVIVMMMEQRGLAIQSERLNNFEKRRKQWNRQNHIRLIKCLFGKRIKMVETTHIGIGIDTPEDLKKARKMI